MKKTHFAYLRRIIGIACNYKIFERIAEMVGQVESPDTPIYQVMRDIVCDARFYSVIQNEQFWKDYSCEAIRQFTDSLTPQDWENDEMRTGKKEDFLNDWLAKHILSEPRHAGAAQGETAAKVRITAA